MAQPSGLIAPDLFRGTKQEEAQEWLESVRHWARFKQLNAAQSAAAIPVLLRDSALTWYNALADAVKDNFDQLCEAFLNRYRPNGITGWRDAATVWSSKQGHHQTVDDFINIVEKQAARAQMDDLQKRYAIIQGLRPTIRQQVLQHENLTVAEIRKWATIAEASQGPEETSTEVSSALRSIQDQLSKMRCGDRAPSHSPERRVRFNDYSTQDHPQLSATQASGSSRASFGRSPWNPSTMSRFGAPPAERYAYEGHRQPSTRPPFAYNSPSRPPLYVNNQQPQQSRYYGTTPPQPGVRRQTTNNAVSYGNNSCYYCGRHQRHTRDNCIALNATCNRCGKIGHFSGVCRGGRRN